MTILLVDFLEMFFATVAPSEDNFYINELQSTKDFEKQFWNCLGPVIYSHIYMADNNGAVF